MINIRTVFLMFGLVQNCVIGGISIRFILFGSGLSGFGFTKHIFSREEPPSEYAEECANQPTSGASAPF